MLIRNIELKARTSDLAAAEDTCRRIGARFDVVEEQVDTFYVVPNGRLKLRRSSTLGAQLIQYVRSDRPDMKSSGGTRTPVADADAMHEILSASLGVRVTVAKRRKVYWLDNAKINIDDVEGLGAFIEFEVVLDAPSDEPAGRALMDRLIESFGIRPEDCVPVAYADLLMEIEANKHH